jgi:hypothetical protein
MVAALLIGKFYELRGQAPDGGEPVSGLHERDCRSLHGSRYRGIPGTIHNITLYGSPKGMGRVLSSQSNSLILFL